MRLQIVVWLLLLGSPGLAQVVNAATLEGDIEYGRYLSSECATCHQVSGADEGIPSITGWEQDTFVSVLEAYQKRKLPNPVMRNIAANLDKEQIQALAVFFTTLSLPE
jgi:cytochrome c